MNSFYNFSSGLKHVTSIIMLIISTMILLTLGAFLFKILFYLIPIALIGWLAYKTYRNILVYFSNKTMRKNELNDIGQVVDSEIVIKRAIENHSVIDVDYKEL